MSTSPLDSQAPAKRRLSGQQSVDVVIGKLPRGQQHKLYGRSKLSKIQVNDESAVSDTLAGGASENSTYVAPAVGEMCTASIRRRPQGNGMSGTPMKSAMAVSTDEPGAGALLNKNRPLSCRSIKVDAGSTRGNTCVPGQVS